MFLFLKYMWDVCMHLLQTFLAFLFPSEHLKGFGRQRARIDEKVIRRRQPKPPWVINEVIRLKALMPEAGCRLIAHAFNRRFAESRQMTVSKTFVNETIRKRNYEIQILRREIKNRKPKDVPKNLVWGVDLTGKMDTMGNLNHILGMVEHKSRLNLNLTVLKDKSSITILRLLLDAVEHYGRPRFLRTDNEPIFTSRLFRFGLWFMRIHHQPIEKSCPWQNGRTERFFGTLKEKLDQWQVDNPEQIEGALVQFRLWYNHVRPHQNLDGRTPAEVWNGTDIFTKAYTQEYWFEAWEGLLTGFYLEL